MNDVQPLRRWALAALLAVATVVCYSNTFHAPFYLDDYLSIIENTALREPGNIARVWQYSHSRFIGFLSFALNYWAVGTNVIWYHVTNLIIHISASLAVYWLAVLVFLSPGLGPQAPGKDRHAIAAFASLLFACHPVQTQAVTYIVQRFASLATLWYLLTVCGFLQCRFAQIRGASIRVWGRWAAMAGIMAALALLTKETAASLPLMLIMVELLLVRKDGRIDWRVPAALAAAAGFIGVMALAWLKLPVKETDTISRSAYLLTQCRVILTYLRLLIAPVSQNLDYDYPIYHRLMQPQVLSGLATIVALLTAAALWFKRHRTLSFAIGWFFIALSVESSLIPIRDVIFEHRLYLPMAGVSVGVAYGLFWLLRGQRDRVRMAVLAAVIICLGLSTFARNAVWSDPMRMWNDAVVKSPGKGRPYGGRGQVYHRLGLRNEALADYLRAVELDPSDAFTWYNLGLLHEEGHHPQSALEAYSHAINCKQDYARAYSNRAATLLSLGEYRAALADIGRALDIDPRLSIPYYNQGKCYFFLRCYSDALTSIDRSIALEPRYPWAHYWRGLVLGALGRDETGQYDRAIALDPTNGRFYWFRALASGETNPVRRQRDLETSIKFGFRPDHTDSAVLRALK